MTDLDLFFIPPGTLHGNQLKSKNRVFSGPIFFVALTYKTDYNIAIALSKD